MRHEARISRTDLTPSAYHEAGHAVIAAALHLPIDFISIDSRTGGGIALYAVQPPITIHRQLAYRAAGPVAQALSGSKTPERWSDDATKFTRELERLPAGERADARRSAIAFARRLLLAWWPAVAEIARLLLDRLKINGAEVQRVMDRFNPSLTQGF